MIKKIATALIVLSILPPAYPSEDINLGLIDAAKRKDVAQVQSLLNRGADVKAKNKEGETALMSAAIQDRSDIAQLLISHGADVAAKLPNGWTALMLAAVMGHTDIVRLLISHGADVNVKANERGKGETALRVASTFGRLGVVRVLIARGADVNAKGSDARSAADVACAKWSDKSSRCPKEEILRALGRGKRGSSRAQ